MALLNRIASEDRYKFICIPDNGVIELHVVHVKYEMKQGQDKSFHRPISSEILNIKDLDDDFIADIISSQSSHAVAEDLDLYLRSKFNDSVVDILVNYDYYRSYHWGRIITNLIKMDAKTIGYLRAVTNTPGMFLNILETNLDYNPLGKNPRKQLGMSKNKAMVFKRKPLSFVLKCSNTLFDGDIENLLKYIDTVEQCDITVLLKLKEANPKITYKNIIKKLCKGVIKKNENTSDVCSMRCIESHAISSLAGWKTLKENGFDKPFSLNYLYQYTFDAYVNEPSECTMDLPDGWKACKITSKDALNYANSLTQAFTTIQITHALNRGSYFILFYKGNVACLGEFNKNVVLKISRCKDLFLMQ